ncbi:septin CDC10 [Sugiyamaella lignohabitans]|uniref:Cell division control protein 10 n=1 Tax=Sugiyamaella lignohabitans TaxID=796027 RepID=A0A161HI51_9ASCO|nr:septin CDC10 [Sugiyamaella lignohabitans]ANB15920.1 septin CDC10 [Sugiyamaella lignohabitans]
MSTTTVEPGTEERMLVTPSSHVGFDSITSQIEKRLLKRGFQFNLMVVGQSGLGKSTLINTLFASPLVTSYGRTNPTEAVERTPEIKVERCYIQENGVKLKLNIIDTPGYGDQVNNEKCWEPIVKYIYDQQASYIRRELTASREKYPVDTRVHCVLFFIQPTGHGLKPIDIAVLKRLTEIANVVPVIAKSDSLTLDERAQFKQTIQAEIAHHNLKIYPYPNDEYDEDERALNDRIKSQIPFAIVGSDRTVLVNGREVRGRKNRWGVINVEDETHCEFSSLRNFLISTHLQDLIDTTAHTHYEAFRKRQLTALKENSRDREASSATTSATAPAPPTTGVSTATQGPFIPSLAPGVPPTNPSQAPPRPTVAPPVPIPKD